MVNIELLDMADRPPHILLASTTKLDVLKISPISERVARLNVISCAPLLKRVDDLLVVGTNP
jgi:hypothetical protein